MRGEGTEKRIYMTCHNQGLRGLSTENGEFVLPTWFFIDVFSV